MEMNFNPAAYVPDAGRSGGLPVMPKPGGHVRCTAAAFVKAKSGDGQNLELEVEVMEPGENLGKTGVIRLSMVNANTTAMQIAASQLSAICHCAGIQNVPTEQALVGAQWRVHTELQASEEAKEKGWTEVKGHYDLGGNPPVQGQFAAPAGAQPAPSAPAAPTAAPAAPVADQPAPVAAAAPVPQPATAAVPDWAKK